MAATTQTLDISIRVEVLNGTWQVFGVDTDVGVLPESVTYEASEWGCLKASFVLRRSPWAAWPDLSPFTPVEIEIGGVVVWEGRTNGTPLKAGAEQQISVQCEGWQMHLDDDLFKRFYVHSVLSDWKDIRSSVEAQLARYGSAPQVQVEAGAITLSFPKGTVVGEDEAVGVVLDLGEAAAKAICVEGANAQRIVSTITEEGYLLYVRSAPSIFDLLGGTDEEFGGGPMNARAEGVFGGEGYVVGSPRIAVATNAYRYVAIFLYNPDAPRTPTVDQSIRISAVSVFSEAAYESGGASVLKASTVIKSALPYAPLLSADLSQIDTAADEFDIPSLVMATYKTPREMVEAVNAFHNWLTYIDLQRRMVFKPPSTEPLLEWGAWAGEQIEDTSAGEGSDIYDAVIVEGTEADGSPLAVTVTSAELDATTVVDERGFTRAKAIQLSNATTSTVAKKVGEVWLEDQLIVPFAGSVTVPVGGLRTVLGGQPVHPSLVCRHVGELLRIGQAIDPSTGGVGRDGRIVASSYEHSTQTATITLGARTDNIQVLLERIAVTSEVGS